MAYPKPKIPIQPVLSLESFNLNRDDGDVPSVLHARHAKFVTSGRIAIAMALQQMGIGKGDAVMLPAYHCPAMVEPVIWSGATPVFYKIHPDTSVDLNDVQDKLDASVKLLIVAHYFGFPQDLLKIGDFCDHHALYLLEDCAHCFFGEYRGKPLGTYGDYAIASTMKFFPVYEGGCLVSDRHHINPSSLHSAGLGFEVKATLNTLEKSFEYGRMKWLQRMLVVPMWLKDFIWKSVKRKASLGKVSIGPGASDGGFGFEAKWLGKQSAFFSRYLVKHVSRVRIVSERRKNYIVLQEALSGLPGCRPLFPGLPEGVIPQVFPLIVNEPEKVFPILKNAGVPIIRFGEFLWDGVDATVCSASVDLSRHLLQFPCHQELRAEEQMWMIAQIRKVFLSI